MAPRASRAKLIQQLKRAHGYKQGHFNVIKTLPLRHLRSLAAKYGVPVAKTGKWISKSSDKRVSKGPIKKRKRNSNVRKKTSITRT